MINFLRRRKSQAERKLLLNQAARSLVQRGWHPIDDPKRVVQRVTGVLPMEGERIFDYYARACGCSRSQVDRFIDLTGNGMNFVDADREIFGGGPSILHRAMEAIGEAVQAFARATRPQ